MSNSSKYKANGWSAYQPIRTKANTTAKLIDTLDAASWQAKHDPQHTKPQFKKRRDKRGNIKLIKVR